jgi:hypothetical protein
MKTISSSIDFVFVYCRVCKILSAKKLQRRIHRMKSMRSRRVCCQFFPIVVCIIWHGNLHSSSAPPANFLRLTGVTLATQCRDRVNVTFFPTEQIPLHDIMDVNHCSGQWFDTFFMFLLPHVLIDRVRGGCWGFSQYNLQRPHILVDFQQNSDCALKMYYFYFASIQKKTTIIMF